MLEEAAVNGSSGGGADASYTVESVHRAVGLLLLVAGDPGRGVSELARRAGMGKARTYRLLRTLESAGMLARAEDGRAFKLGYTSLIVGAAAAAQLDLVRLAQPVMQALSEATGETVQLRLREGDEAVCVSKLEPPRDLRVHARVGRRRVLGAGSNKVLLAFADADDREATLARIYASPHRPALTPEAMAVNLEAARRDGYCVTRGEVSQHLVGIAAPVFTVGGDVVAALNIAAPAVRMDAEAIDHAVRHVTHAASTLSQAMGFQGDDGADLTHGGGSRSKPRLVQRGASS